MDFEIFDFIAPPGSSILSFGDEADGTQKEDMHYILITGRWGGNHDAPNLTDTIILAGFNLKNQTISLFSIPRDLYVEYPNGANGRINQIYETYLYQGKNTQEAMGQLTKKVAEITGKDVEYYINIDFQWFIEIIDTLGWVEVTLEENLVDYEYPNGPGRYKTFILKKGTWTLDGEVALMYARSRHSTSDFDRSLRQQQIIAGLKQKASNLGYFKDRKKIQKLYQILSEYVDTNIPVTQMLQQGMEVRSWEDAQTLSFNLNDTCYQDVTTCQTGWFLYVPIRDYFWGASVLLPDGATAYDPSVYDDINTYADMMYDASDIYTHPENIIIYNTSNRTWLAEQLALRLKPYGFSLDPEISIQSLREENFENSVLYYNGIEEHDSTLVALQAIIDMPMQEVETPIYSPPWTSIEILLANDDSF